MDLDRVRRIDRCRSGTVGALVLGSARDPCGDHRGESDRRFPGARGCSNETGAGAEGRMTAVDVWVRAVLRRHWRATVVLSLLIGVAGAAAIGAADGARRTQTAFPRMREETNGADLLVSVGGTGLNGFYDDLGKQPEVESYGVIAGIPLAVFDKTGKPNPTSGPIPNAAVDDRALFRVQRPKIVAGHIFDPNAVDEAVIDPKTTTSLHLHVGSTLPMFLATNQAGSKGVRVSF